MIEDKLKGEFSKSWQNYGDADPREHGGRFLKWKPDRQHFELVTTREWVEPEKVKYLFQSYFITPDMIWLNGNPGSGFTDKFKDAVEGLARDIDPENAEDIEWVVPELAFRMEGYDEYSDNYWKFLRENYGIYPYHK